jgi:tetratricopeptide (TPR) repeat protein
MKYSSTLLVSIAVLTVLTLDACQSLRGPPPQFSPGAAPGTPGAQTGGAPSEEARSASTPGEEGERPGPKQFHLGPAATALVAQSHQQATGGNFAAASATLERAVRIEPENPLLWIELGQVRMQEGNAAQASSMGRKALALATGDVQAQASAWRLIADALRAQGRDPEAADAKRRADALAAR